LLSLWQSGWLLGVALSEGTRFASRATVLRHGDLLALLAVRVAPLVALGLLAVAVVQVVGGWHAYGKRHPTWGVLAGVVGAVNVLALPVSLVAAILIGLDRDEFE
jgi:hypothetical protein